MTRPGFTRRRWHGWSRGRSPIGRMPDALRPGCAPRCHVSGPLVSSSAQWVRARGECLMRHRPRQPALARRLRHCPPALSDQPPRVITQPLRHPAPWRRARQRLGERLARAAGSPALPPPLHPHHADPVLAKTDISRPCHHLFPDMLRRRLAHRTHARGRVGRHQPHRPAPARLLIDLCAIQRESRDAIS
jgi:hypothetical protein